MAFFTRRKFVFVGSVIAALFLVGCASLINVSLGLDNGTKDVTRVAAAASVRQLEQGQVEGFAAPNGTHMWPGIPFAESVSGEHRWTLPRPHEGWQGTLSLLDHPQPCFQFGQPFDPLPEEGHIGIEDCLTLDVIAPVFAPDAVPTGGSKLPVMVWVHGGGNTIGEPFDLTKNRLVPDENIILVSLRYRLGPFGWFSHPALRETGVPSSNFGTEDIIAGLQWVQNNISAFGGDADNVTLFGQSAGGVNTFSLMLSPHAKGLFHQAIIQSGSSSTATRVSAENSLDHSEPGREAGASNNSSDIVARLLVSKGSAIDDVAANTQVETMSAAALVDFLKSVPALELIQSYQSGPKDKMFFFPNVIRDGYTIPFAEPRDIVVNNRSFNAVPTIFGTNRDELKPLLLYLSKKNILGIPVVKDKVRFNRASQYLAQAWKLTGADEPASWMIETGSSDTYVYRFDWDEEPSYFGIDLGFYFGASHNMEVPFVMGQFENTGISKYFLTKKNAPGRHNLSSTMRQYWAEFARHGKPGSGRDNTLPPWRPRSPEADSALTMIFDASEGGTRMIESRVDKTELTAALLHDDILNTEEKCDIFGMFMFTKVWTDQDYALFDQGACL